jgi:uncharacterized protein YndB with AHSA1/START domain
VVFLEFMPEETQSSSGQIHKRVLIKANPAIIYQALTNARDLVRWFCDRATSDPRVGGELSACWRAGKVMQKGRAIYTRLEPDTVVELLWVDDGHGPDPNQARHKLTYTIRARRTSSEVTMHDEDSPAPDPETTTVLDEGWNNVLLELKDFCERRERSGKGRPSPGAVKK